MDSAENDVKALLDHWSAAARERDIDKQVVGSEAVRRNFLRWFGLWKVGIHSERRDLEILASGDVAVAHELHRTSGTLNDVREVDYFVRVTDCCKRSNGRWLITHEHVSLPVDMASGRVIMDLKP